MLFLHGVIIYVVTTFVLHNHLNQSTTECYLHIINEQLYNEEYSVLKQQNML